MRKQTPGHLYVFQTSADCVKVGFAGHPPTRFNSHRRTLAKESVEITRQWVSPCHHEAFQNEELLIAACCGQGGIQVKGKEWFSGISFDQAVSAATALPMTPWPPAGSDTRTLEQARATLTGVTKAVLAGQHVTVTRFGRPAVVFVNPDWYATVMGPDWRSTFTKRGAGAK